MTVTQLKDIISTNFFWDYQVKRLFPEQNEHNINVQLSRMSKRGDIIRLKRGLFCFPDTLKNRTSEFVLAQLLYKPSYVSLESALNLYGVLPDVPQNVISVSPTTTKKISTQIGVFFYSKISTSLFYGFESIQDPNSQYHYNLAVLEKALLDYIYIRKIKSLSDLRLDFNLANRSLLKKFSDNYPSWVKQLLNEQYNK